MQFLAAHINTRKKNYFTDMLHARYWNLAFQNLFRPSYAAYNGVLEKNTYVQPIGSWQPLEQRR